MREKRECPWEANGSHNVRKCSLSDYFEATFDPTILKFTVMKKPGLIEYVNVHAGHQSQAENVSRNAHSQVSHYAVCFMSFRFLLFFFFLSICS